MRNARSCRRRFPRDHPSGGRLYPCACAVTQGLSNILAADGGRRDDEPPRLKRHVSQTRVARALAAVAFRSRHPLENALECLCRFDTSSRRSKGTSHLREPSRKRRSSGRTQYAPPAIRARLSLRCAGIGHRRLGTLDRALDREASQVSVEIRSRRPAPSCRSFETWSTH
jgi:hypothetical protein